MRRNSQKDKEKDEDKGEDKNEAEYSQETKNEVPDGLDAKNKNNDNQKSYFNNKTEEATTMGADMEAISVEAPSGLINHVEGFRSNADAKSVKDCENTGIETKKAKDMKDSDKQENVLRGTDTEQVPVLKDGWEYYEMEEEE